LSRLAAEPAAGRDAYAKAHLPRARFADLLEDLSGPIVPGQTGRHPLPELDKFVAKLRRWGVGMASQVVVYDDAGGAFAARLWWMLRWLGHDDGQCSTAASRRGRGGPSGDCRFPDRGVR